MMILLYILMFFFSKNDAWALAPKPFLKEDVCVEVSSALEKKRWTDLKNLLPLMTDSSFFLQKKTTPYPEAFIWQFIEAYSEEKTPEVNNLRKQCLNLVFNKMTDLEILSMLTSDAFGNTFLLQAIGADDSVAVDLMLELIEQRPALEPMLCRQNTGEQYNSTTPLELAIKNNKRSLALKIAQKIQNMPKEEKVAALNHQNNRGNTALMMLALLRWDDILQILLDSGAKKNLKNDDGVRAYDLYLLGKPKKERAWREFKMLAVYLMGDSTQGMLEFFGTDDTADFPGFKRGDFDQQILNKLKDAGDILFEDSFYPFEEADKQSYIRPEMTLLTNLTDDKKAYAELLEKKMEDIGNARREKDKNDNDKIKSYREQLKDVDKSQPYLLSLLTEDNVLFFQAAKDEGIDVKIGVYDPCLKKFLNKKIYAWESYVLTRGDILSLATKKSYDFALERCA